MLLWAQLGLCAWFELVAGRPVLGVQAGAIARAEELEAENAQLRQAAGRRRAVLAQSRQFLAAYAQRAAAMLSEQQAAGASPAPTLDTDPNPFPVSSAALSAATSPGHASRNGASASAGGGIAFSSEPGADRRAGPGSVQGNGVAAQRGQSERGGVPPSALDGTDLEGDALQE